MAHSTLHKRERVQVSLIKSCVSLDNTTLKKHLYITIFGTGMFLFKQKKGHSNRNMMVISWPFDAIHKTHIHFDADTGEMTLGKAPDWEICMSTK